MGLDLWIIYLLIFCGCLMQFSFISENKSWGAILLRIAHALAIPFSISAFLGCFGVLLELLL
jgi:hypothetical protein